MWRRFIDFCRRQTGWNIRHGEWWMLQWQVHWWTSFGIHFDPKNRVVSNGPFEGKSYGPYIDIHFGCVILSLGWRPYLCGEIINQSGVARGGYSVPSEDDLVIAKIKLSWRQFVEIALFALLVWNVYKTYMIYHPTPVRIQPFTCEMVKVGHHLYCEPR